MKLLEKVAIITGSGRGMGKEYALAFAKEGAKIVVNDTDDISISSTIEKIKEIGGEAIGVVCDVSKSDSVKDMVSKASERFGRIDILVNNAGINPFIVPAEKINEEGWDRVMDVNLKGVFLCCKEVGKIMIKQKSGTIVNISSQVALFGEYGFLPYAVSKAGVITITRNLAYEWARYNIRVNSIAPGFIAGGMNEPILKKEKIVEGLATRVPMKRFASPKEIANVVLFLVSDDSSYINGETIVIDGGMTGFYPVSFLDLIKK
ncbi:MAG: SDR family oxidoreductase [Deltaproteobacteria bacterium]|nr:SDR family oxidoreductase [Deltaproteobacteria bacterium]